MGLKKTFAIVSVVVGVLMTALLTLSWAATAYTLPSDLAALAKSLAPTINRISALDYRIGYGLAGALVFAAMCLSVLQHRANELTQRALENPRALEAGSSPEPEFVRLEDAGRWLYTNSSDEMRDVMRSGVPNTFANPVEHATAFVKSATVDGVCKLYGRWADGLPMEVLDPKDGDFSVFEAVFGANRKLAQDMSVRREDLQAILARYSD